MVVPNIEEFKAIDQFLRRCTVPIFWQQAGAPRFCGTGTLFEVNRRRYIVTAEHVFKDDNDRNLDFNSFAIPIDPDANDLSTLDRGTVYWTSDRYDKVRHDIGVISLDNQPLADEIGVKRTLLSPANLGSAKPEEMDFLVSGYLATTTKLVATNQLTSAFTNFRTTRFSGALGDLEPPVNFTVEFFLANGDPAPLHGISGAAIWVLRAPPSAQVSQLQTEIKVVGVMTNFKAGSYIRANGAESGT